MLNLKSSKLTEALGWYGSAGLMVVAWSKRVTQSVILNLFWIAIGLVAIVKMFI